MNIDIFLFSSKFILLPGQILGPLTAFALVPKFSLAFAV